LFDLLKREEEVRDQRTAALRFLESLSSSLDSRSEHEYVERAIRDAMGRVKDNIASLERQIADLGEDERTLEAKIRKKQAELQRNQQRLESLQGVRCVDA
jgi:clusterin-associated protein 1